MEVFRRLLLPTFLVQVVTRKITISAEASVEHGASRAQQGQGLAQALDGRGSHGIREHDDARGMGAGPGRGENADVVVLVGGYRAL